MTELEVPRRALRVLAPVTVDGRGWSASLEPDDGFSIAVDIDFPGTAVSHQSLSVPIADGIFKRDLARARTFGFLNEVEELRAAGLARGGSLDNVVVIDGEHIVNDGGLRFEDEFVRHKALDALGDLYLAGGPLLGRFRGMRTGHAANNRLLRALFARKDAWRWESLTGDAPAGAGAIAAPWSRPCAAVAGL
jgi:UDP-3-O-[3-hydroxymyristoyl] N-acetylglucosamine deacetylase